MPLLHSPLSLLSWRDTEPLRVPSSLRMTDGPELQMVLTTPADDERNELFRPDERLPGGGRWIGAIRCGTRKGR
jgi:hypothetical protein